MNLTNTELRFLTSLLGHHIIGEAPVGLYTKLAEAAERRQLGPCDPLRTRPPKDSCYGDRQLIWLAKGAVE